VKASETTDIPRIGHESLIIERLPLEGARVIDIGCGEGWLTQLVAPHTDTVIGIDPSATALGRARAENTAINGNFVLASAEDLPLDHVWADIVIYFNSLHHVPEALQSKALEEASRVLAQGGILCIVEPLASGAAYELFQPAEDESAVYATTYDLIRGAINGIDFEQVQEELFVDSYTYQDFEEFLDSVLVVDEGRAGILSRVEPVLRERFDRLGDAVEGGRCYDQVHRLNILRKL